MEYNGTRARGVFYFDKKVKFTRFEAIRYMGNKPDAKKYLWDIKATQHSVFMELMFLRSAKPSG
jgi:hypothetical protein